MILDKIKILSVIVGLFLVLLVVPVVLGANEDGKVTKGSKLLITDLDVKVDSKTDKNLDYGDKIKEEAKPGSVVKFTIEAKNNFTDDEDLKIEDIQITATIEGIDNDDDLEKDTELNDLKAEKDNSATIEFTIPLEVDEGDYDVLIEVEGEDENGTTHVVEYALELEVQKEDNEVKFLKNTLTPSEIKCGRTVQLSAAVINTGADDEKDATLEITNAELGISLKETFDLSNDAFDDDSKFRKSFTLSMPKDVEAGIYSIPSKVTYDNGGKTETETAELVVAQCEVLDEAKDKDKEDEAKKEDESNVIVNLPSAADAAPTNVITAGAVTTPTLPATEESSLFESKGFLAALIAGEALLVLIAILLVAAVFKKKRD